MSAIFQIFTGVDFRQAAPKGARNSWRDDRSLPVVAGIDDPGGEKLGQTLDHRITDPSHNKV